MKDISISAIADTLDRFRLMDDPYEWHDNEGVESTKDIAEHLFDNEYRSAVSIFTAVISMICQSSIA